MWTCFCSCVMGTIYAHEYSRSMRIIPYLKKFWVTNKNMFYGQFFAMTLVNEDKLLWEASNGIIGNSETLSLYTHVDALNPKIVQEVKVFNLYLTTHTGGVISASIFCCLTCLMEGKVFFHVNWHHGYMNGRVTCLNALGHIIPFDKIDNDTNIWAYHKRKKRPLW